MLSSLTHHELWSYNLHGLLLANAFLSVNSTNQISKTGLLLGMGKLNDFSSCRPYAGGVASRLATAIYVAMVTPNLYDILIVQMTQISKVKIIAIMVDYLKIVKLWHLSILWQLAIELNT